MTTMLPPSPFTDSAAFSPFTAAQAVASPLSPPVDAAAVPIPEPVKAGETSTVERALCDASGLTRASRTGCCEVGCGQAPEVFAESSMTEGGHQEAPAAPPNSMAAGATDHIHEIFHYARKLVGEDGSKFVLDETRFMAELFDEAMRQELIMPSFLNAPSPEYLKAIA